MTKTRLAAFTLFILSIMLTSSQTNVLRCLQNSSTPSTTTVVTAATTDTTTTTTESTTIETTESATTKSTESATTASSSLTTITFDAIKDSFEKEDAWGLHTTVDLKDCDADLIRSAKAIEEFIVALCDNVIEMKRFGDPLIVNFGEDENVAGFSMVQLIETSNITGHFANKTNSAYIDIFSCKLYNPYTVEQFTKNFFKARSSTINVLLRK